MTPLRLLCLFTSAALREGSLFANREGAWVTDIDQGRCEFVGLVVDEDVSTLATSGLFAGATLVCRRPDLSPALATALRPAAASFARAAVPLEIVPAEAPVAALEWLSAHAPELAALCRLDGEVSTRSPSWWRDRARRHLARGGEAGVPDPEPEDLQPELREFVARRGW
jgi:hypothetical protein